MEIQRGWNGTRPETADKQSRIVGIVSIAFGAVMLSCSLFGAAMMPFHTAQMKQFPGAKANPMPAHLFPGPVDYLLFAITILLYIALGVAGTLLLRADAKARMLHIVFAVGMLLLVATSQIRSIGKMQEMQEWLNKVAPASAAMAQSFTGVSMACGIVLNAGYPVFLLIWFGALGKGKFASGGDGSLAA